MKLHYRHFPSEHNSLNTIVILHGLLGSSQNWISTAKKLSPFNDVYALDLRNHGKSPHTDSMAFADVTQDIIKFIEAQSIKECSLLGHSLGGKVAMYLACHFPDRIKNLIVVDIAPKRYSPHHVDAFNAMNSMELEKITSRKEASLFLNPLIKDIPLKQFLITNLIFKPNEKPYWQINLQVLTENLELVRECPIHPGVDSFDKPTFFIKGGKSTYITDSDYSKIQGFFPNSSLRTIKDSGHNPHVESQAEFLQIVNEFITHPKKMVHPEGVEPPTS